MQHCWDTDIDSEHSGAKLATVTLCDHQRVTASTGVHLAGARGARPPRRLLLPPPTFLPPSSVVESTDSPAASAETQRARDLSTGPFTQQQQRRTASTVSTMCEIMSLSILQVLSVLSFLTSILAVLHVGAGPLHRLSSKFDADVHPASHLNLNVGKQHLWNWSGLPVSFSLGTFIGDESREHGSEKGVSGYIGGSDLVRMNWQVGRPRLGVLPLLSHSLV